MRNEEKRRVDVGTERVAHDWPHSFTMGTKEIKVRKNSKTDRNKRRTGRCRKCNSSDYCLFSIACARTELGPVILHAKCNLDSINQVRLPPLT